MSDILDILSTFGSIGKAFLNYWWLVFPTAFFYIFKILWRDFVIDKSKFSWLNGLTWIMLEVIPPKEIEKSPKIMESFLVTLAGVYTTHNAFDLFLKGAITDRFSLEIVGNEGQAHFYIRTQKKYRNLVESSIYAQYPDAEVIEVNDYSQSFPKVIPNRDWDLWGTDFQLTKEDAYPIKCYDKFEEDITGTMIDPLAGVIEVLGTLGPGQHIWLQLIIEALSETHRKDEYALVQKIAGRGEKSGKGLFGHLGDVFASVPAALFKAVEFPGAAKADPMPLEFKLTPVEKDVLKAIEENLGRNAFKTKMRFIYLGKRETFQKPYVSAFLGAFKQFNDLNYNNFKPEDRSKTYANYFFTKPRLEFRKRIIYRRYKTRNMDGVKMVFSTKELASIFHFPDMNVKAPSLQRTEAKRGTAPSNLPI